MSMSQELAALHEAISVTAGVADKNLAAGRGLHLDVAVRGHRDPRPLVVVERDLARLAAGGPVATIGHYDHEGVRAVAVREHRYVFSTGERNAGKAERLEVLGLVDGLAGEDANL